MKFSEDFTMPGTDELKSLESWANVSQQILKCGRTTLIAPEGLDDEAKDAWLSEAAEKDPTVDRFRTINEHTPLPGMEISWIAKVEGDTQQY